MEVDPRAPAEPVTFAGGVLDRYRHVCSFVNGDRESDAVLDPFISQGIDRGDRLLYVVSPAETATPINRIRRLGYDAGDLLHRHRCEVHTWADTYLRTGDFDPQDTYDLIDHLLLDPAAPQTRMMCDMGWAADRDGVADQLIEFEARANFIHAQHQHVVICSYDASLFDGGFIVDVLRTHPMVVVGGMLQENPFFVDPAEFLEERARLAAS
jgi:hypothetical protein